MSLTRRKTPQADRAGHPIRKLLPYLWPKGDMGAKARVLAAVLFLILAKVATVYVPIVYSQAIDRLAPKHLHGQPAAGLTAVLVILTGIVGAIMVTPLLNRMRITDKRARGFAAGLAAHGLGTARAFQVDPLAGTFAGIAMGLNALLTAILVPLLL